MISLSLTKELRNLQKQSFPELKWVCLVGTYVPLEKINSGGRIVFNGLIKKDNQRHDFLRFGYGLLKIPDYLARNELNLEREGILAHELSHLTCVETTQENVADLQVINRGLGYPLYLALKYRENLGITRHSGYTSKEILSMMKRGAEK